MEVAIGTDRIVLKGNNHVIKFPRVSLVKPIKETWHLKQYGKAAVVDSWRLPPPNTPFDAVVSPSRHKC